MSERFETPAAAEAAFYEAFEALDGKRMRDLWAASTEVSCVHPGGPLLTGRDAVVQSWVEIFNAADPPQMEYRVLQHRQADDLAVHLVEERIRASGSKPGSAAVVFATNVYTLTDGGWRLISHHASTPLVRREVAPARQLH